MENSLKTKAPQEFRADLKKDHIVAYVSNKYIKYTLLKKKSFSVFVRRQFILVFYQQKTSNSEHSRENNRTTGLANTIGNIEILTLL